MVRRTSLAFRTTAAFLAVLLTYSSGAAGFNALATGAAALHRTKKQGPDPYPFTDRPGPVYYGSQPGRDPARDNVWRGELRRAFDAVEEARRIRQLLEHHEGESAIGSFSFYPGGGTGVATASGGSGMPGEGVVPAGGSMSGTSVNTNTGNRSKTVSLGGWTARGGMGVPFTLVHNSTGTYNGDVGKGWSHSYDAEVQTSGATVVRMPDGLSIPFTLSGSTYTPPAGRYEKLAAVGGGGWTLTFKNRTVWNFNSGGVMTSIVDRSGNTITLTRNTGGYLTTVTDPVGRTFAITYNSSNRIDTITDPMSRVWTLGYNTNGDLTSILYPDMANGLGAPTRYFAYDASDRIISETDLRGKTWTTAYDSSGRLWKETNPLSQTTTYTYSTSACTITKPLALGSGTVDNYSSGVLASRVDPAGFSDSYTARDANKNVTTWVDRRGKTWTYTYDARGSRTYLLNPLGRPWYSTYATTNELLSEITPLGRTTTYGRDAAGRLTSVTDPLTHVAKTITYNSYGQPLSVADALSRTTSYHYDATSGNRDYSTSPASVVTYYGYAADGRLNSTTDSASKSWSINRDGWGREVGVNHPGGSYTLDVLDGEGHRTSHRNELAKYWTWTYDDAGRELSNTNPLGDTQTTTWTADGVVDTITDGNSHARSYLSDARGDVYWVTLADSSFNGFIHNANGDVSAKRREDFSLVYFNRDNAGRLYNVDYPNAGTSDVTYGYDDDDRKTSMADGTGTTTWTIDAADRVTQIAQPGGTTSYVYNVADQRTKLTESGLGDTNTTYDSAGRLSTIQNRFSETTTFGYDSLERLSTKALANGTTETYGYDGRDRTNSIATTSGSSTIRTESYGYDAASRITGHTVNAVATTYGYDDAGQLLSESRTGYSGAYTYDANGNRLTRTVGGTTENYAYNNVDQIQAVKISGTTIRSYGYNAFGSATSVTTSSGTTALAYDDDERAVSLSGVGLGSQTSAYNGEGTRTATTVGSATSTFLRDGTGVTAPVLEDGSATYTPGISERRGSTTTYQTPGLKNVAAQTNSSAAVSATRQYDAFGNVLSSSGTFKGPFGYGGMFGYQEDASGLKLLGRRYYDSGAGRFVSRDPARDGRNWYAYCGNDPVGGADPWGLWAISLNLSVQLILPGKSWSLTLTPITICDDGITAGATVGSGGGIGLYGGAGLGLSLDQGGHAIGHDGTNTVSYAQGLATPSTSIELVDDDGNWGNGGISGGGVSTGPGLIGGVYREMRTESSSTLILW